MKNNDNPQPKLSIVIGALREEKRIGRTLESLSEFLHEHDLADTTEVIVVIPDGGDRTLDIVESFMPSSEESHQPPPAGRSIPRLRIIEPGLL